MSKEVVDRPVSKIYESESTGEVQIADDVVATIAGLAATGVEGVYAMYGNLTNRFEEGKNYNKDKAIHVGDDITM